MKLQDLIRAPTRKPLEVFLRQATPETYLQVLREIKAREIYNLVIGAKAENMHYFLKGVTTFPANHKEGRQF